MKNQNLNASHPLQAFQWGQFRQKTGVKVVRGSNFQMTIHKIPNTPFNIGYLPKGEMPTKEMIEELKQIGKENNCIFIQLEPNVVGGAGKRQDPEQLGLRPAAHPLFTQYSFVLDLTKSEDELLKNMSQKTRYNIKVAQKHGVEVIEDNSDKAFREYLRLTQQTTERQKFFAHTQDYHKKMWEVLRTTDNRQLTTDNLIAHLLLAKYRGQTLVAWILFTLGDTLYYPYGASSNKHRETMASNLMMWEAIKFGKKLGLSKFDMWGALGPNPDPKDPWYGFHKFKQGYGGELVEFVGSYDLVINPVLYELYKVADKVRWGLLKFKK